MAQKRYDVFCRIAKSSYHFVIVVVMYHCTLKKYLPVTVLHYFLTCVSLRLLAITCSIMASLASRQLWCLIASVISR